MQFDKYQLTFITASRDGTARLFDTKSMQNLKTYDAGRPVNAASISSAKDHVSTSLWHALLSFVIHGTNCHLLIIINTLTYNNNTRMIYQLLSDNIEKLHVDLDLT